MNNPTSNGVSLLAEQFPNVSPRILTAALVAFIERTGTVSEAVEAAAHRIVDATAT